MRRIVNNIWLQEAVVLLGATELMYKAAMSTVFAVQLTAGVWAALLALLAFGIGCNEADGQGIRFFKEPEICYDCEKLQKGKALLEIENTQLAQALLSLRVD